MNKSDYCITQWDEEKHATTNARVEDDLQMEGGSMHSFQMEGGSQFPTKKQAKKEEGGFSIFSLFFCLYRNMMNFLGSLWSCKDGKCRPTFFGLLVMATVLGLYVYFTFLDED